MKRILSLVLAIIIFAIPINLFAKSNIQNSTETVVSEILNNESISKETKEWLTWFKSLSAEDQQYISYRPFELDGYKYEKEYKDNNINSNNFSEINTRLFGDKVVLPMGKIPDNLGSKILPVGGYEINIIQHIGIITD